MDEARAREILKLYIEDDDLLWSSEKHSGEYLHWSHDNKLATLDGLFSVEELEAITWWMRNKYKYE